MRTRIRRFIDWLRGEHKVEDTLLQELPHDTSIARAESRRDNDIEVPDDNTTSFASVPPINASLDERIAARIERSGYFLIRCPRCGYEFTKAERGEEQCPNCSYTLGARRYCWTCMEWIPAIAIIHHNDNEFCPFCYYNLLYQRRGRLLLHLMKYPLIVLLIGIPIWLVLIYLRWGTI